MKPAGAMPCLDVAWRAFADRRGFRKVLFGGCASIVLTPVPPGVMASMIFLVQHRPQSLPAALQLELSPLSQ